MSGIESFLVDFSGWEEMEGGWKGGAFEGKRWRRPRAILSLGRVRMQNRAEIFWDLRNCGSEDDTER